MEVFKSALKTQINSSASKRRTPAPSDNCGNTRSGARNRNQDRCICYLCGQEGHIRRDCPLNYTGPAWMAVRMAVQLARTLLSHQLPVQQPVVNSILHVEGLMGLNSMVFARLGCCSICHPLRYVGRRLVQMHC